MTAFPKNKTQANYNLYQWKEYEIYFIEIQENLKYHKPYQQNSEWHNTIMFTNLRIDHGISCSSQFVAFLRLTGNPVTLRI